MEPWQEEYNQFKQYFPNHPNPEHYPKAFENLVKQWHYRNKRIEQIKEIGDEGNNQQVVPGNGPPVPGDPN